MSLNLCDQIVKDFLEGLVLIDGKDDFLVLWMKREREREIWLKRVLFWLLNENVVFGKVYWFSWKWGLTQSILAVGGREWVLFLKILTAGTVGPWDTTVKSPEVFVLCRLWWCRCSRDHGLGDGLPFFGWFRFKDQDCLCFFGVFSAVPFIYIIR